MHPGDMLFIPKGIAHCSMLCEDSTDDNVLIELKVADDLAYVGGKRIIGKPILHYGLRPRNIVNRVNVQASKQAAKATIAAIAVSLHL